MKEVMILNKLRCYIFVGTIFVLILGTLAHFFYEWSNGNPLIGLFTPINESTWEHMKLVFFPMLLFTVIATPKLKDIYPCITSSFLSGILIGTCLIPIFFYTYTGILGYNLLFFDICCFILAVIAAFCSSYKLTLSCIMQKNTNVLLIAVGILLICFVAFTLFPPDIALFADPV